MKKIQYIDLQKKYSGKVVILNKAETKILAVGHKWKELLKQLKEKGIEKDKLIIEGPIASATTINVYFSIQYKNHKRH